MGELFTIVLRFALYLDLMLLFGLALFSLYGLPTHERPAGFDRALRVSVPLALILSCGALLQLTLSMTGATALAELDLATMRMLVLETDAGQMWLLRLTVLLSAALLVSGPLRSGARRIALSVFAATALATLAWNGHGAMDEGARRYLHLGSDILHLLAAGTWLGALAAFNLWLHDRHLAESRRLPDLLRALKGFETVGGLIVAALIVTGLLNYWLIIGPDPRPLVEGSYGGLLLLKLLLFAGMLGLAALNRFHLVPRLQRALKNGSVTEALGALRRSLLMELSLALLIIALVAWFGTLSPRSSF